MKTNKEKLVIQSVCGSIHHPTMHGSGHWVGYDGYGRIPVGPGGIHIIIKSAIRACAYPVIT